MILQDTPYEIILQTMLNEEEKVSFFKKKQISKAQQYFQKQQMIQPYPLYWYTTYTIPSSRNTYLIWFEATEKEELKNGNFKNGSVLQVNEEEGKQTVYEIKKSKNTLHPTGKDQIFLKAFTGHFLSRYRERCLWGTKMTTKELIVRFLARNYSMLIELDFSKLNLNSEKYPNGAVYQIFDGIVFVNQKNIVTETGEQVITMRYNTYMSKQYLKESQTKATMTQDDLIRHMAISYLLQKLNIM